MAHRITVKAKDDFRSFKKDYEVVFDFEDTNINFLLGKNGCGKSTLIRAIRGTMNSNNDKDKRWAAAADCREILKFFDVDIEGFDKVYHLDADGLDDNLSMYNASSASDLVDLGGWGMNTLSQGERSLIMMARLKQMVIDGEDTVIIFDELDNHLDFDFRVKFVPWLNTMFPLSKKIIITHDLLMTNLNEGNIVYMMSMRDAANNNKCRVLGKEAFYYKNEEMKKIFFTVSTSCEINKLNQEDNGDERIH